MPIFSKDVSNARTIFGPDLASIRGKTVQRAPEPVVTDYVAVPRTLIEANKDSVPFNGRKKDTIHDGKTCSRQDCDEPKDCKMSFIQTVHGNYEGYTKREVTQAKEACRA